MKAPVEPMTLDIGGGVVPAPAPAAPKPLGGGDRLKFTATFARQLQVLVGTGIPLSQALHATERQIRNPRWIAVVAPLRAAVDEGTPLSRAMTASGAFDAVSVSLVAAGESSGNMAQMLSRLCDLKRRQLKLRNTVIGALSYPCLLIMLGMCVLTTMLLFVIPRFETLFKSLDSPLPVTTKALLQLSLALREHWLMLGVGVLLAVTALWYMISAGVFKHAFDKHYLSLPGIGFLGRSLLSARIARMLGTLLEAKVPLTEALELTRRAAVNVKYVELIEQAELSVARGQPLSNVLESSDLLLPGVREAIRTGEASGRMGEPLLQMADFLDEENDTAMKSLTSTIEPLILVGLGMVVGFVALSIFLPMFDMITAAQGGA
jgi:type IV pilus assembly protein PilC